MFQIWVLQLGTFICVSCNLKGMPWQNQWFTNEPKRLWCRTLWLLSLFSTQGNFIFPYLETEVSPAITAWSSTSCILMEPGLRRKESITKNESDPLGNQDLKVTEQDPVISAVIAALNGFTSPKHDLGSCFCLAALFTKCKVVHPFLWAIHSWAITVL